MAARLGLFLTPLDILFFRGGRPLVASIPGVSTLPNPQTLAGAIATAVLRSSGAKFSGHGKGLSRGEFFQKAGLPWLKELTVEGPWLARQEHGKVEPYFAMPRDLRRLRSRHGLTRLRPRRDCPGWIGLTPNHMPLWPMVGQEEIEKADSLLLGGRGMVQYLNDSEIGLEAVRPTEDFYQLEERIGIGIDAKTRGSEKGKIYSTKSLRLQPGVGFYAAVTVPEEGASLVRSLRTLQLGGDRRLVEVETTEAWQPRLQRSGEGTAIVLLSPGFFKNGWLPMMIPPERLVGAAVAGPFSVSGWDLAAGGPKPTRFGADAGAVYLLKGNVDLPPICSEGEEDRFLGYGSYLKGNWSYGN